MGATFSVATHKWSARFVFRTVRNKEVSPGAAKDGFTAVRKTNDVPTIGAAFPHKEGIGFNIELKAFPVDGRLVVLPPDTDDGNSRNGK